MLTKWHVGTSLKVMKKQPPVIKAIRWYQRLEKRERFHEFSSRIGIRDNMSHPVLNKVRCKYLLHYRPISISLWRLTCTLFYPLPVLWNSFSVTTDRFYVRAPQTRTVTPQTLAWLMILWETLYLEKLGHATQLVQTAVAQPKNTFKRHLSRQIRCPFIIYWNQNNICGSSKPHVYKNHPVLYNLTYENSSVSTITAFKGPFFPSIFFYISNCSCK